MVIFHGDALFRTPEDQLRIVQELWRGTGLCKAVHQDSDPTFVIRPQTVEYASVDTVPLITALRRLELWEGGGWNDDLTW